MSPQLLHVWMGVGCLVLTVHAFAIWHLSNTVRSLLSHMAYHDALREGTIGPIGPALRAGLSDLAWRNARGTNQPQPTEKA